ncbi:hypothetical protein Pmar_PMAR018328 [Perkinsus marinus ATCC 50983]|uniref:PUM-HD domain-containing protein n=1 Tax=Perkinsus marinus (strain ATCC 50983 / TXsc) TaxID=423536 RepID=C5LVT4_PERM5|nr:hypothetical protein Pmar_PMAR018328 [Perkinsus marinus ATCC 50983]EEQ99207.1 hypothetical protein Pmar_PMAR018328 [Perkinsus marinus ATCC 50983]|eukprot:XP_002766490.1 hypothetical protein Pmar_PMAR018328 [Perkinsus marinus ATCC 50983]
MSSSSSSPVADTQVKQDHAVPLSGEDAKDGLLPRDFSHVTWRSSSPFAATPDPFLDLPTYPIGCLSIPSTADAAAASAVAEQNGELQREPPGLLPYGERASPLFPTPMGDSGGDSDNITMTFRPMANTCSMLDAAQVFPTAPPPGGSQQRKAGRQRSLSESSVSSWEDSSGSSLEECPSGPIPNPREAAGPLERALAEAAQTGRGLQERDGMTMSAPPPRYTAGYLPNSLPFNGISPLLAGNEYDIVQQLALLQQQAWVLGQLHATNEIFRNYNINPTNPTEPYQKQQQPAPTTRTSVKRNQRKERGGGRTERSGSAGPTKGRRQSGTSLAGRVVSLAVGGAGSRLLQGHLSSGVASPEEIRSFVEECRPSIRMLATDRYGNYFIQELCHYIDPSDVCILLKELVTAPGLGSKVLLEMGCRLKANRQNPPDGIIEIAEVLQDKLSDLLNEPSCFTLLEAVADVLPTGVHVDQFVDAVIYTIENLLGVANNRNGSLLLSTCVMRKPDCIPELCSRIALVIDGDTITPKRQLSGHGNRLLKTIKSYHGGQSSDSP